MKIAYLNARYSKGHTGGGSVHVEQFVQHTLIGARGLDVAKGFRNPTIPRIFSGGLKPVHGRFYVASI